MKHILIWMTLSLSLVACRKSKYDSEFSRILVNNEERTYLLHVPYSYDADSATSLIIALHGGLGSAKNIEEQSGLASFADVKGFILCSPNGQNRTWNAGNCCGKASDNDHNDIGFISDLIDTLLANYNIDPKRVYVTGMSNGAMMSYRLACQLGDKIAAIAPVAGTMVLENCRPTDKVSIIHFHSQIDSNIPYQGGIGDGVSNHYNPPLDSIFEVWSNYNGCSNALTTEFDRYRLTKWTNCKENTEINFYLTKDGGHSWPMGFAPRAKADEPSLAVNANELIWEFFLNHPKP